MKKILCGIFALATLTSCIWGDDDDGFVPVIQASNPVVMERDAFEASVAVLPAKTIQKSGKIYLFDQLLFINEVRKGFHVYNYADATNPVPLAFIQSPGATDLAMRNGTIYINQAVDLISVTYGIDSGNLQVTHRNRNVFPQMRDVNGFVADVSSNQIIVDYEQQ